MFFILLAVWIIFSGDMSLGTLGLGAAVSGLVSAFSCKFLGYRPVLFYASLKKLPRLALCILNLIKEIFAANMAVLSFVWGKKKPESLLVHFRGNMETTGCRVLAANSITLTPGTLTVRLEGDDFYVHALDRSLAEGIEDCSLVKMARELEDK